MSADHFNDQLTAHTEVTNADFHAWCAAQPKDTHNHAGSGDVRRKEGNAFLLGAALSQILPEWLSVDRLIAALEEHQEAFDAGYICDAQKKRPGKPVLGLVHHER